MEYQLKNGDTNMKARKYPITALLQIKFNPFWGIHFSLGPGIEIEKRKNLFVFNFGFGYKIKVWKQFDVMPEFIYLLKGSETSAFGINLILGWIFNN